MFSLVHRLDSWRMSSCDTCSHSRYQSTHRYFNRSISLTRGYLGINRSARAGADIEVAITRSNVARHVTSSVNTQFEEESSRRSFSLHLQRNEVIQSFFYITNRPSHNMLHSVEKKGQGATTLWCMPILVDYRSPNKHHQGHHPLRHGYST